MAIDPSSCLVVFCVKKSNEAFCLNVRVERVHACVEFIHVFLLQAHVTVTVVDILEPPFGGWG